MRRRVAQGHREVVLTGINLGCFRDRAAGFDLPRLVREARRDARSRPAAALLDRDQPRLRRSSSPRCARRRPSAGTCTSRCSRATTACSRAMRRRYTVATYLRRLEPLADEFNLTSDVIVGFPAEDDAAFERTLETVERAGLTKVHVFPYSPRPGTVTAADDPVPPR